MWRAATLASKDRANSIFGTSASVSKETTHMNVEMFVFLVSIPPKHYSHLPILPVNS